MLEEKIEKLIAKRKTLNGANSFKEISELWEEIKEGHQGCSQEIQNILTQLDILSVESQEEVILPENFDFDEAFNEVKRISEEIKNCSVSKFATLISRINGLKRCCIKYLSAEKAKIEEVTK